MPAAGPDQVELRARGLSGQSVRYPLDAVVDHEGGLYGHGRVIGSLF
jgi:hypothetical protein